MIFVTVFPLPTRSPPNPNEEPAGKTFELSEVVGATAKDADGGRSVQAISPLYILYIHTYMHACMYIYIYVCVCVCSFVSMCVHVYIYIYIDTHTYIYIYMYICRTNCTLTSA